MAQDELPGSIQMLMAMIVKYRFSEAEVGTQPSQLTDFKGWINMQVVIIKQLGGGCRN